MQSQSSSDSSDSKDHSDLIGELDRTNPESYPALFRRYLPDSVLLEKSKVGIELLAHQIKLSGEACPYLFFIVWDDDLKLVSYQAGALTFDMLDPLARNGSLFKLGLSCVGQTILGIGFMFLCGLGDRFDVSDALEGRVAGIVDCGISAFSSIDGRTCVSRCALIRLDGLLIGLGSPVVSYSDPDLFSSFWFGYKESGEQ